MNDEPSVIPLEAEVIMDNQNGPQSRSAPPEARPLLTSRALLIILTAVLAAVAVALKPAVALPVGVGVGVVTLLVKILDD